MPFSGPARNPVDRIWLAFRTCIASAQSVDRVWRAFSTCSLHIPDIYRCMEPALIDELKIALSGHVEVPE